MRIIDWATNKYAAGKEIKRFLEVSRFNDNCESMKARMIGTSSQPTSNKPVKTLPSLPRSRPRRSRNSFHARGRRKASSVQAMSESSTELLKRNSKKFTKAAGVGSEIQLPSCLLYVTW